MDLAIYIQQSSNHDDLARFFSIAWGLWRRRNKVIYEKVVVEPKVAIEEALVIHNILQQKTVVTQLIQPRNCSWQPPSEVWFKLNTDGTIFFTTKRWVLEQYCKTRRANPFLRRA